MIVVGNVAIAAPGDEIKSPDNVVSGKSYYIKGVYTSSGTETACYYAPTDAAGKFTGNAVTDISAALPIKFTQVDDGWTLTTPNGYYVRPHTSNGQTFLVADEVVLQLASGTTKEGTGKGIKIGPYTNTNDGSDWYIQCNNSNPKIGGYKTTSNQWDVTLIECGDAVSSAATFAETNPSIDFPATSTYSQEVTTAAGYTGTVSYEITANTAGATIDGSTVTVTQAGSVTVKATAPAVEGFLSSTDTYTLTVTDAREENGLAFAESSQEVTVGEVLNAPTLTNPNNLAVTYSSSDTSIATVDADGNVTGVAAGTATITATFEGNNQYIAGSASYTINVKKALPEGTLFYESVSKYTGSSDVSTELTTTYTNLDSDKWGSFSKVYPGKGGHLKFGSSNAAGTAVTGSIALTGNGKLTYKVMRYDSSNAGKLTISVGGADVAGDTEVTGTEAWVEKTVYLTNATGNVVITFASDASNKRIRVDDILLVEAETVEVSSAATFAETAPSIDFPATSTYTQEATTAEGYTGTVTYEITANTAGATIEGSTLTVTQVGSVTVKATAAATEGFFASTATYTLTVKKATVLPEGTLFYESLSGYTETSDNNTELSPTYSGLDYNNWASFSKVYPGKVMTGDEDGHLKFGSSSSTGKAVTGSIALNGNGKLTYKVRSYDSKNAGKLTVSVTGADFDGDTEVTGTAEWVEKTVNLTNANGEVVITFETSSDNKRIRVDDIMLVKAEAPTTYSLVVGEEETPFESLSLTKELSAHTQFYIKDNKGNEYHSADAQSELIIIAENHENLPTSADGKDFYLMKANTWVFTLTELTDAAGITLTVNPETPGETKYMLSGYLQESDDVFDENLKLTKEMTSTTEEFYFTRSDDYGLTNLTPATFNAPEDRRYWIFSEDDPTVEFIAGEIRGSYTVGEEGTYTFTLDLENNTVTAEKYVETVDVTITSAEWGTFVTPVAVRFPVDVRAYVIRETRSDKAIGEEITEAPAGTPVIVNGAEGIHNLTKIDDAAAITNNLLLVSDGNVTGDGTIFVLAVEGGKPGFAPLANGKTLSDGKAYLKVDNASGAKINFVIDDATDIRGIESTVDFSDGDWYNLQGVKVTSPQRGIYIHNGKKVVIK